MLGIETADTMTAPTVDKGPTNDIKVGAFKSVANTQFISPNATSTTKSVYVGGNWKDFKLYDKEAIVGIYGEKLKNCEFTFKSLGFVIGKFD